MHKLYWNPSKQNLTSIGMIKDCQEVPIRVAETKATLTKSLFNKNLK